MFDDVVWFFDNASLIILCIIGFAGFSAADTLSKIRQTPMVFAISAITIVAHFVHLYSKLPDATFQSLWQPLIRSIATGCIVLGGLMSTVVIAIEIWKTHFRPIGRFAKAVFWFMVERIPRKEPVPYYVPVPPPIPLPTPAQRLTLQVKDAQEEYQNTIAVLTNVVAELDDDEAEEIEMLAKQKLLLRLNELLGGDDA